MGKVFLYTKICCSNDQLVPQSHELFEILLSRSKLLDQANFSVVVSLEHDKIKIQVLRDVFGPRRLSKSVFTISKVNINGKT